MGVPPLVPVTFSLWVPPAPSSGPSCAAPSSPGGSLGGSLREFGVLGCPKRGGRGATGTRGTPRTPNFGWGPPPQLLLFTLKGDLYTLGVHRPPWPHLTLQFGGAQTPPGRSSPSPILGATETPPICSCSPFLGGNLNPPSYHDGGGVGSLSEGGGPGGVFFWGGGLSDSEWIYLRKRLLILSHTELTLSARLGGFGGHQNRNTESQRGPPDPQGPPPRIWGGGQRPPTPPQSTASPAPAANKGLEGFFWGLFEVFKGVFRGIFVFFLEFFWGCLRGFSKDFFVCFLGVFLGIFGGFLRGFGAFSGVFLWFVFFFFSGDFLGGFGWSF